MLERVFEFLNRFYLKNSKKQSLGVTAMNIFVDICYASVKVNLIEAIMQTFKLDRNGTMADEN